MIVFSTAMLPENFAFVDVETTGMSIIRDRIIEIGILRVENGKLVSTFNSLINPQAYLSSYIENMTGIASKELENAPTFNCVKKDILNHLTDSIFVAHNSRFDYAFIKNEFKRLDITFSAKNLCTVKLSKYLFPRYKHHGLDNIIDRFNIACRNRHRAFDDAKVLWEFFQIVKTQFDEEKIKKAFKFITKRTTTPLNITDKIINKLPESSGVYIFYGKSGAPLYIGKSVNIKERVLSHFSNDHNSPLEMKITQNIESIETIETAGELGALFKESMLIKKMQPLYNRKLRIKKSLVVLKKVKDKKGFETVEISVPGKINAVDLYDILGIFKSKKQTIDFLKFAAKKYNLCEKILGIEKAKKSCFGYHLEQCFGACIGLEKPVRYNLRFMEAFYKDKIKPWPFKGPVLIKESNGFEGEEVFLVDKWCLLGSYKSNEDLNTKTKINTYDFDQDVYKILTRYLTGSENLKNIRVIKSSK